MKRPSAADRLRQTVKAWAAPRGRQAELARRLGVEESSISKWLNGGNTNIDLDAISEATGLDLSDLFGPVQESPTLNGPVTPAESNTTSNPAIGDVSDAANARVLEARNHELEKENAALRAGIKTLAGEFKRLVSTVRPGSTADAEPRARRRR